jgi:hypothetical protein
MKMKGHYSKMHAKMKARDEAFLRTIHGFEISLVLVMGVLITTGTFAYTRMSAPDTTTSSFADT